MKDLHSATILFCDLEVNPNTGKVNSLGYVIGAESYRGNQFQKLSEALKKAKFLCGHNFLHHDLKVIRENLGDKAVSDLVIIDTLYLSPLLRPNRKSHKLDKDYHLSTPWKNDPLADANLCKTLLADLMALFRKVPSGKAAILWNILHTVQPFKGFFAIHPDLFLAKPRQVLAQSIRKEYEKVICGQVDLSVLLNEVPTELAYVLTLVTSPLPSIQTPSWLLYRFPRVVEVFDKLRTQSCGQEGCSYCQSHLDPVFNLKRFFNYKSFRKFKGDGAMALQEKTVRSALANESLLAIFPTGGGKSLTFQLPALMRGKAKGTLTVVISPLQALMKDQVDVLKGKGIVRAVAINGLLDPLERKEAIEQVQDGFAHILYISPESLRSNTILRLLEKRMIDRFVVDEAHCFSAWGQDFRVDYHYIGKFIRLLQQRKNRSTPIPVSCFTATARTEVVEDICTYFQQTLDLDLTIHQTFQGRTNLQYRLIKVKEEGEKPHQLLKLLGERKGPAIVYVSRVAKTLEIATFLRRQGEKAAPYNGKMPSVAKQKTQDQFTNGEVQIIVATSAFGMGVDKDDVDMVIHYQISNSLENYVQEAGRAGRDPKLTSKCIILFREDDLNQHFALLQLTQLNQKDISQIWKGIKKFGKGKISRSALEIARKAGWNEEMKDLDTKVKTAINALEKIGYVERWQNSPRIFATGLIPDSFMKAQVKIKQNIHRFSPQEQDWIDPVLQGLFSSSETRVDYMADRLGIPKNRLTTLLNLFKDIEILGDDQDLTATIDVSQSPKNGLKTLRKASKLEPALLVWMTQGGEVAARTVDLREANEAMTELNLEADIMVLKNLLQYWETNRWIEKNRVRARDQAYHIKFRIPTAQIKTAMEKRLSLAHSVHEILRQLAATPNTKGENREKLIEFSVVGLKRKKEGNDGGLFAQKASIREYEKCLLYLQKIGALYLKDGLLVYYNRLNLSRVVQDNRKQYTQTDYNIMAQHYQSKIEQVHIVGEYAKRMENNYQEALQFTSDYFSLDYAYFLKKYFPKRTKKIQRPLTTDKYNAIFGQLSLEQHEAVKDGVAERIMIAAGPGSGKTRVLVHKMASLLLIEETKPDQFLMLAFSRPAAMEFRSRLQELVPGIANHVDIYTYHGFAFQLVGQRGNLEKSENIIQLATECIEEETIPMEKILSKNVVVLDEFQDISQQEYTFLQTIIEKAGDIRVVAAGDDDQSIYDFRGASITFMKRILEHRNSTQYFLSTNYRSKSNLVDFANQFLALRPKRLRIKSDQKLSAYQKDTGKIRIVRYQKGYLLEPLVAAVLQGKRSGSTAILTATNDEALQIVTLLGQRGVSAMLISSQEGFSLRNLVELQSFTDQILNHSHNELGFISEEVWQEARLALDKQYASSADLPLVQRIIGSFQGEYERKFRGEWLAYVSQLKLEDFYFPDQNAILVSTMHKAKGKEFDNVYLLLDQYDFREDERKRVIYVAITRAKSFLEIHTNGEQFSGMQTSGQVNIERVGNEHLPATITLNLGMKDVNLGFFMKPYTSKTIHQLYAGIPLTYRDQPFPQLFTPKGQRCVQFSFKFGKRLEKYFEKGYRFHTGKIAHIVWWKEGESGDLHQVLLPQIEIKRKA